MDTNLVTLIPKIEAPSSIDEFRPVSIVGCLYKIIHMILARRLRFVISDIIIEIQSGFIDGKNILNGLIIANATVLLN